MYVGMSVNTDLHHIAAVIVMMCCPVLSVLCGLLTREDT